MINGGATSSGDQDTEDTELMAIYTTENGIAEKVRGASLLLSQLMVCPQHSPLAGSSCLSRAADLQIHIREFCPHDSWSHTLVAALGA